MPLIEQDLIVGVDDTGHDVKFFGATSGKHMHWDEDSNGGRLNLNGGADLYINQGHMHMSQGSYYFKNASTGTQRHGFVSDGQYAFENVDLRIQATQKLYLDGGSNTYITESAADTVKIFTGGDEALQIDSSQDSTFAGGITTDGTVNINNAGFDKKMSFDRTGGKGMSIEHDASSIYFYNETDSTILFRMFNAGTATLTGVLTSTGLDINGNSQLDGTLTVGVDDTGYDVKVYGATSGRYLWWDESDDSLRVTDGASFKVGLHGDLKFYHNGNNSFIQQQNAKTGNFYIEQATDDADLIFRCDDGSGGTTAYITLDGSEVETLFSKTTHHSDNIQARFGDAGDLRLYHDGSNSYIQTDGTGDLYIDQNTADKDVILRSDDGSGGTTAYITLDGSASTVEVAKVTNFAGDVKTDMLRGSTYSDNSFLDFDDDQDSPNMTSLASIARINYLADTNGNDGATAVGHAFMTGTTDVDTATSLLTILNNGNATFAGHVNLAATKKLYFDGGTHTYLTESSDNNLQIVTGGTITAQFAGTGLTLRNTQVDGTITVGADDTGHDVKFFGATSGRYMEWDESEDHLLFTDNTKLKLGTGGDLQILHDGSDSYIVNGTGALVIQNTADNQDIIFQSDDGSGGQETYFF